MNKNQINLSLKFKSVNPILENGLKSGLREVLKVYNFIMVLIVLEIIDIF